MFHWSHTSTVG